MKRRVRRMQPVILHLEPINHHQNTSIAGFSKFTMSTKCHQKGSFPQTEKDHRLAEDLQQTRFRSTRIASLFSMCSKERSHHTISVSHLNSSALFDYEISTYLL